MLLLGRFTISTGPCSIDIEQTYGEKHHLLMAMANCDSLAEGKRRTFRKATHWYTNNFHASSTNKTSYTHIISCGWWLDANIEKHIEISQPSTRVHPIFNGLV